jgi:hypothetical protein
MAAQNHMLPYIRHNHHHHNQDTVIFTGIENINNKYLATNVHIGQQRRLRKEEEDEEEEEGKEKEEEEEEDETI